jgi:hypothetical protein
MGRERELDESGSEAETDGYGGKEKQKTNKKKSGRKEEKWSSCRMRRKNGS